MAHHGAMHGHTPPHMKMRVTRKRGGSIEPPESEGKLEDTDEQENKEEKEASTNEHFKRGGRMKRKHGGHVGGKKSEHRPDRKRASGGESSPFSAAGKMSSMPFEAKQAANRTKALGQTETKTGSRHADARAKRANGGSVERNSEVARPPTYDSPITDKQAVNIRAEEVPYLKPSAAPRKRGGGVAFRTKSGSVSEGGRRAAEAKGDAMPGGRFPIRNASDLSNAKHAFGRANDKPAVKRWIDKRAKELGKPPMGG